MQQWVETLTEESDWGDWPLSRYVFSDTCVGEVVRQRDLDAVAWACAMVACGLALELPRLRRLTALAGGVQYRREDGAQKQRCSILSGCGAGSHLDFWHSPAGVIEFDRFVAMRVVDDPAFDTGPGPAAC